MCGYQAVMLCRDTVLEITLTVASAFLCFWVAEDILGVSGVLAVVTLAIWMAAIGKYAISPEVTVRCPPLQKPHGWTLVLNLCVTPLKNA